MDQWDADVVRRLAMERHREDLARGASHRRLVAIAGPRPWRARFAVAILTLAARLDTTLAEPSGIDIVARPRLDQWS